MSTFRPPQIPQQPRQNFTSGQALGAPIARSATAGQEAAYFRDRREPAQPIIVALAQSVQGFVPFNSVPIPQTPLRSMLVEIEETLPNLTIGTALGVPKAKAIDQQAAYFRDKQMPPQPIQPAINLIDLVPPGGIFIEMSDSKDEINILSSVLPNDFTQGLSVGVPPPRSVDQSAAYMRILIAPQQFAPRVTIGAQSFVPAAQPPVTPVVKRDDSAILDEVFPYFTNAVALGSPPPRTQDQSVAYWRSVPQPLQIDVRIVQTTVQTFVPALAQFIPSRSDARMDVMLNEVLPELVQLPAAQNAPPKQEQIAAYWRYPQETIRPQSYAATGFSVQPYLPPMKLFYPQHIRPFVPMQPPAMIAGFLYVAPIIVDVPSDGRTISIRAQFRAIAIDWSNRKLDA